MRRTTTRPKRYGDPYLTIRAPKFLLDALENAVRENPELSRSEIVRDILVRALGLDAAV